MAEIKHLIRIANTDLVGKKSIGIAMAKIKGIGYIYAHMVCKIAGIDVRKKAGALDEKEVKALSDIILNPDKHPIPKWMKNRRHDYVTGQDKHIVTGDLQFTQDQDLRRLKKIRSYRGFRHAAGLPTRGQKTKSNFRRNKGKAVGVKRKSGAKSGRV